MRMELTNFFQGNGSKEDMTITDVFGEDGKVQPWALQAFKAFLSTLNKPTHEGDGGNVARKQGEAAPNYEMEKETVHKVSFPSLPGNKNGGGQQGVPIKALKADDELRKGMFLQLIQLAANKGGHLLKDANFLALCSEIMMPGQEFMNIHESKVNRAEAKGKQASFNGLEKNQCKDVNAGDFQGEESSKEGENTHGPTDKNQADNNLSLVTKGETEKANRTLAAFSEDGQIRPWLLHAFECFISSFCQLPLEGRSSFVSSVVAKATKEDHLSCTVRRNEECQQENLQACNEKQGQEEEQNHEEISMSVEDEVRKEELFKLIRQASNKGEAIFKDAVFLDKCTKILVSGNLEDGKPNPVLSMKKIQNMESGKVVELGGEGSDVMEVDASFLNSHGRKRKDAFGPAGNKPPDKGDYAVYGNTLLPMLKRDCIAEKSGSKAADKGQPSASLGERACTFADIVKVGKTPSDCLTPSHVGQFEFSNCSSLHNVQCMGNTVHVTPAVQDTALLSLEADGSGPSKNKETLVLAKQAVSENVKENSKQTSCCPVSSKDDPPLLKIDNETLNKRLNLCKYSIIGKITLAKGEEPWAVQKLRGKLEEVWKLHSAWRLIGLGKGFFQILLLSQEEWDKVWTRGPIHLKPGMMRLQRWSINFDPLKEKMTNAQVWFRIFQLPWGLWDPNVIWEIARKVGVPLKIDNATLNGDFGYYARVLVDVDLSKATISDVHIECGNHKIEVKISPENLPSFCRHCHIIGHSCLECRYLIQKTDMSWQSKGKRGGEPGILIADDIGIKPSKTGQNSVKGNVLSSPYKKVRKEVECFEDVLGSHFVNSAVENRIIDESIMKEVFNVMGNDKQVQHVPDTQANHKGSSNLGIHVLTTKPGAQDQVVNSNRFSALWNIESSEDSEINPQNLHEGDRDGCNVQIEEEVNIPKVHAQFIEDDIDLPKVPSRWSDLIDEEGTTVDSHPTQETNTSSMEASSNFERTYGSISGFRANLLEDCIWLNHDDDPKYDRDMCVEIERYKNSAKATRNFIANLPKKDKKVKMAFRQPQGKASSPKG